MFVPCPHCGFLVALIVKHEGALQRCPRCSGIVQDATALAEQASSANAGEVLSGSVPTAPHEAHEASASQPAAHAPAGDPEATTTEAAPHPAPAADAQAGESLPLQPSSSGADAPTLEASIAAASVGTAAPRRTRRAGRPRRSGTPSFVRAQTAPTVAMHWRWMLALVGLTLLLALQLLLAQRRELAADPRWRPSVAALCKVLFCDVPAWREPGAFTMLQRNVRPKAGQQGVLTVDASFRNDARWPQPWPTLVLSLSDVDGRQVGMRAFTPAEYRPRHDPDDQLLPGQSTSVTLDVMEPAPRIVAFSFDFR